MKRPRGFTVVETLIVMVLLAAFVVAALVNGAGGVKRADTLSVAELIASTMRAARQQALTEAVPVAVVLPSEAGTRPHSQSFYIVAGDNPRITSIVNIAPEHPRTGLAAGLVLPTSTVEKPLIVSNSHGFDFTAWLVAAGVGKDYAFCFLPDGTLVTNDLPLTDGVYAVLVSAGLDYQATSAPAGVGWGVPPSYFEVTEVSSPRMVVLSPSGEVSVRDTLAGVAETANLTFSQNPAGPPSFPEPTSNEPRISDIEVRPKPDPDSIPPGIEALVDVDGHLNLKVVANDSDPEKLLYCKWSSDRGGGFSRPDRHQMSWVQDAGGPGVGGWTSTVVWRPPPGTTGGELFTLSAEVFDPEGGSDDSKLGVSGVVQAVDEEKIIFESIRDGVPGLFTMLPDGSGVTRVGGTGQHHPILSPAGDMVVYAHGDSLFLKPIGGEPLELISMAPQPTGGPNPTAGRIEAEGFDRTGTLLFWTVGNSAYVAELNGYSPISSFHRLNNDPGWVDPLAERKVDVSLSPDSSMLVYGNGGKLFAAQFNPNPGPGQPYLPGGNNEITLGFASGEARWAADGSKLAFISDSPGNYDVYTYDFDPGTGAFTNPINISNNPAQEGFPALSPDGSRVIFGSTRTGNWDIFRAESNGSGQVNLSNNPSNDAHPVWGR